MNFQKTLYIAVAVLLAFSTIAHAEGGEPCGGFKPVWRACLRSDDCMTGKDYCRAPIAHARSASSAIAEYNGCMLRATVCTSVNHDMPKVPPVCAAGQCVPGTPSQKVPGQK